MRVQQSAGRHHCCLPRCPPRGQHARLRSAAVCVPSPFIRRPQQLQQHHTGRRASHQARGLAPHEVLAGAMALATSSAPGQAALQLPTVAMALLGAAGVVTALAYLDAHLKRAKPHIQFPEADPGAVSEAQQPAVDHRRVISRCPTLLRPYEPVPFLTNRHVETIFAAKFRREPTMHYIRECLLMPDGGCVTLDWEHQQAPDQALPATAPVLILLPGLTGGSHDSYVVYAVQRAASLGMRAVVFNSRGTGDSPVTVPQYYSASFTGDTRAVVSHIAARYPDAPLLAAGWSLGANILVRYLGEEGAATPLRAAVSLCNPFNLTISNAHLRRGFNKVYDANLAASLRAIHARHAKLWTGVKGKFDLGLAATCRTIAEFDDAITIHSFGWPSVEAYYAGSSSALSIPSVTIPLLCIQAMDDPIAPAEAIPYKALAANPNTLLVTTPCGGHLGWCSGDGGPRQHPWSDQAMAEWLVSVLQELPPAAPRGPVEASQPVAAARVLGWRGTAPVVAAAAAVAGVQGARASNGQTLSPRDEGARQPMMPVPRAANGTPAWTLTDSYELWKAKQVAMSPSTALPAPAPEQVLAPPSACTAAEEDTASQVAEEPRSPRVRRSESPPAVDVVPPSLSNLMANLLLAARSPVKRSASSASAPDAV